MAFVISVSTPIPFPIPMARFTNGLLEGDKFSRRNNFFSFKVKFIFAD